MDEIVKSIIDGGIPVLMLVAVLFFIKHYLTKTIDESFSQSKAEYQKTIDLFLISYEKAVDKNLKENELQFVETIQKRVDIALEIISFCRNATTPDCMTLGELVENQQLVDKVMCWYPDTTYILFRDLYGKCVRGVSSVNRETIIEWHEDVEPLLFSVVKSIRSDSNLIAFPTIDLSGIYSGYHFLPTIRIVPPE